MFDRPVTGNSDDWANPDGFLTISIVRITPTPLYNVNERKYLSLEIYGILYTIQMIKKYPKYRAFMPGTRLGTALYAT